MSKSMVIVESPAKVKTLSKLLGGGYTVRASMGHVRDLPKGKLGVDVTKGFEAHYVPITGRKKTLSDLKKTAKKCDLVYLATDPDREGEAIGWHIAEALKGADVGFKRVTFNEITSRAVKKAFEAPRNLNMSLVDAQQARRILDRLVGYKLSPILWKKVAKNLSAGRVQSVAVRLVYERELEIEAFVPEEYWTLSADLQNPEGKSFRADLTKRDGKKIKIKDQQEAEELRQLLQKESFSVRQVKCSERKGKLYAPFTTSSLQQEAYRRLNMTSERTMRIAQQLYEGIESVGGEAEGLITYMRTDSVRVSSEMVQHCRDFIQGEWGEPYLPKKAPHYKSSSGAQEAHEAIRPTDVTRMPEELEAVLSNEQFRLYALIWRRFVASQMAPARLRQTSVQVEAKEFLWEAKGVQILFDGAWRVYPYFSQDEALLPDLEEGMSLDLKAIDAQQHFTKAPGRYTDASLVKALEEKGIGRPSTYAPILGTIRKRQYVERNKGRYFLTELGRIVTKLLLDHFPRIMDVQFTATLEEELDKVENGDMEWTDLLQNFYGTFSTELEVAEKEMKSLKEEVEETDLKCEKCGSPFVVRRSVRGEFLACSGFPKCKNTKNFKRREDGSVEIVEPQETDEKCEKCGSPMVVKEGRYGPFLACSGYPECKNTRPLMDEDPVPCPMEDCDGKLLLRRSKRGRTFFGCNAYPKCEFTLWRQPVNKACPSCGFPVMQKTRDGDALECPRKECGYVCSIEESEEVV